MTDSVADRMIAARQERAHRGAAWCREALAEAATERGLTQAAQETTVVLSGSELILARARQRAALERRAKRIAE